MYKIAGANQFGQWFAGNPVLNGFQNICTDSKHSDLKINLDELKLVCMNWSYNIFKIEKAFYVSGLYKGLENQLARICLPEECYNVSDTDLTMFGNDYNLLLINIKTHTLWIISLELPDNIKEISFTESPMSTSNGHVAKKIKKENGILKVVATNSLCLCLTTEGLVYSGFLPSHLDTSHCVGKVCDLQCGYEHFILLTDAGKVYTWGNGWRLQLGHGYLKTLNSPKEVEGLAGQKIIKIRAAGWHSMALSSFGDLFVWGWNDTGQLGIKHPPPNVKGVLKNNGILSYPLPTVVDLYDENEEKVNLLVKDIACGTRHSAIMLEDHTIWTTGYNKYGQLGFPEDTFPTLQYFKKSFKCENGFELICGPWATVLINTVK